MLAPRRRDAPAEPGHAAEAPRRAFQPCTVSTIGVNLSSQPPGKITGISAYAWSLLAELTKSTAWRFVLFSPDGHAPFRLAAGVEMVPIPFIASSYLRAAYEQVTMPRLVKRHRIDLLFSIVPGTPLFGRFKQVTTVHDLYDLRYPEWGRLRDRFRSHVLQRAALMRSDAIIAVSHNTARDIGEFFPRVRDRVHVVHEAPALRQAEVPEPDTPPLNHPYALVVANITPNKNIDVIPAAIALLRAQGVQCPTVVVGRDNHGLLKRAVERHGVADLVLPVGSVSDGELHAYYRHAVCTIQPSTYEGFCLPVLEAQAFGSPVIITEGGALREVAGDAIYFAPDNPHQLAAAIRGLMEQPEQRLEAIRKGLRNVRQFSWERAAAETGRVFEFALGRGEEE